MRRMIAAGVALALVLGAAACGGGESGTEVPATASVAPPDSLFANALVRPEGEEAETASEALSKLLDTDDPGAFIVEQLDNVLADEDAGITYAQDVEPWLGENAAIFFTAFSAEPDGAVAVEVTDQEAAQETVDAVRAFGDSRARSETYEGVGYEVDRDDTASGFVDGLLVVGTEQGFREAVDASTGDALADDETFTGEYETVPDGTLAAVYANTPALFDSQVEAGEFREEQRERVDESLGAAVQGPAIATLAASADSVALQTAFPAGEDSAPAQSPLLGELPADAWLAVGAADAGDEIESALDQLAVSAFPNARLESAVESLLGSSLQDLTGWMGDAAGFASGTSLLGLGAAFEVETTDEGASEDTLEGLADALASTRDFQLRPLPGGEPGFSATPRGLPAQIVAVQREGRVVVGLGERSVDDVLEPDESLQGSESFGSATEALGSDYATSLFLQFEPMLELLEGTGATEGDPDYGAAQPYLDHLTYLVAGRAREDDRDLTRVVLGLR